MKLPNTIDPGQEQMRCRTCAQCLPCSESWLLQTDQETEPESLLHQSTLLSGWVAANKNSYIVSRGVEGSALRDSWGAHLHHVV